MPAERFLYFRIFSAPGIVTLGYAITMALDNSFRRDETAIAQHGGENTDELIWTRLPALHPSGSGISVMLWDEVEPSRCRTIPPLDDDSPET
ncbi:MAG: hypothetical protein CBHOC_2636 [uncultured Caballeronia sp.]|nr:MAG: hypothetical protein CBHOC_2636 [uncultured Caballeronia sp.]